MNYIIIAAEIIFFIWLLIAVLFVFIIPILYWVFCSNEYEDIGSNTDEGVMVIVLIWPVLLILGIFYLPLECIRQIRFYIKKRNKS